MAAKYPEENSDLTDQIENKTINKSFGFDASVSLGFLSTPKSHSKLMKKSKQMVQDASHS